MPTQPEGAPHRTDELSAPEQRERLAAAYAFVYCYHSEANARAIVEAVADCDTVVVELPGLADEAERQAWTDDLNWLADAGNDAAGSEERWRRRRTISRSPFQLALMDAGLAGSGKRIELMDITRDDPEYEQTGKGQAAMERYMARLEHAPVDELRALLVEYALALEAGTPPRDAIMARQLQAHGRHPGRIGVVTGLLHPGIESALLANADADTSSVVIRSKDDPRANDPDRTDFTQYEQLCRRLRQEGATEPDPQLVDRQIAEDLAVRYTGMEFGTSRHDDLKLMTQDEVSGLLECIDAIRSAAVRGGAIAIMAADIQSRTAIEAAIFKSGRRRALAGPAGDVALGSGSHDGRRAIVVAVAALTVTMLAKQVADYLYEQAS